MAHVSESIYKMVLDVAEDYAATEKARLDVLIKMRADAMKRAALKAGATPDSPSTLVRSTPD